MSDGVVTYPAPDQAWGKDVRGRSSHVVFNYTGPDSYAAGGTSIAAGDIKLGTIENMPPAVAVSSADSTKAVLFVYNKETGKIQAFGGAAGGAVLSEITDATDLSDYSVDMIAEGRG